MSLNGNVKAGKSLTGKIENIRQIADLTAMFNKVAPAVESCKTATEYAKTWAENARTAHYSASESAKRADEAAENAEEAAENAEAQTIDEASVSDSGDLILIRKNGREINAGNVKGEAGKDAEYNLVANALKGKEGGNPVVLSDVSPLPHEIKVKLKPEEGFAGEKIYTDQYEFFSGDGIYVPSNKWYDENDGWCYEFEDGSYLYNAGYDLDEIVVKGGEPYRTVDVSGRAVQKYGINLFNADISKRYNGAVTVEGEVITTEMTSGAISWGSKQTFRPGRYTVSVFPESASVSFNLFIYDAEDWKKYINTPLCKEMQALDIADRKSYAFEVTKDFVIAVGGNTSRYGTFSYKISLEVGESLSAFESYKEPEPFTADGNGNLSIIGNGESMTLIAEEGVTMEAEYNVDTKKYIDKKFAELQALVLEV